MKENHIKTNLEYREVARGEDKDYFIETLSYPINLEIDNPHFSRMQFPVSKAILIRTSPITDKVTIHIMKDTDLYSSFVNFEIDLSSHLLNIEKQEGYINVNLHTK